MNYSIKKLLTLFVILLGWSFNDLSAQSERKGYIGLNLGTAIPIGNFADDNINNEDAGYAEIGTSITLIDFGYRFGYYFGLGESIGGGVIPLVDSSLELDLSYAGLYVGPLISLPLSGKIDFNIVPKFGRMSGSILLDGEEIAEDSGFGTNVSAAMLFKFSKKWGLTLNGAFDYGNLEGYELMTINLGLGVTFLLK